MRERKKKRNRMRSGEKKTGSGLLAIECGRKWESGSEASPAKDSDGEQREREKEREGEREKREKGEREEQNEVCNIATEKLYCSLDAKKRMKKLRKREREKEKGKRKERERKKGERKRKEKELARWLRMRHRFHVVGSSRS